MANMLLSYKDETFDIRLSRNAENREEAVVNGEALQVDHTRINANSVLVDHNGTSFLTHAVEQDGKIHVWVNGETYIFEKVEKASAAKHPGADAVSGDSNEISAPMPGKILKILVKEGQEITQNERLFIVEAMKMENEVKSPRAGIVKKINFSESDLVSVGETVVELGSDEK